VDFGAAAEVTARIAHAALTRGLPSETDVLNVNVPRDATPDTPWRWTRVSRQPYYETIIHDDGHERRMAGWRTVADVPNLEPDADIRALAIDQVVSISPLTLDPTAPLDPDRLDGWR
jgi:5'-nucleotidase